MKNKIGAWSFIVLFLLLIAAPTVFMIIGLDIKTLEKRALAPEPTLWDEGLNLEFPMEFDDYFSDHFGLRGAMTRAFSYIMVKFDMSPNRNVIVGEKRYELESKLKPLFFSDTLPDFYATREIHKEELKEICSSLDELQVALKERGIEFRLIVAPNKNSTEMFRNMMPLFGEDGLKVVDEIRYGHHEWLIDFKNKYHYVWGAKDPLYYFLGDTHWTMFGANVAFQNTMKSLGKNVGEYEFDVLTTNEGDLRAGMLNLPDSEETYIPSFAEKIREEIDFSQPFLSYENPQKSGNIYMFADSFGENIFPFFANEYGLSVYDRNMPYDFEKAISSGCDTIIILMVERNIQDFLMQNDWNAAIALAKGEIVESDEVENE